MRRTAATELGNEMDFFLVPPVDPSRPTPAAGGGSLINAHRDRPEIRAFMEYVV